MTPRRRGPAERPNLGEPSTPRPAASVVLLRGGGRHSDRGLEVLLLKRTEKAKFMPGVWVFPGGAVDPEDGEGEDGHRACAARELTEEAGIELDAEAELVLFSRWITPEVISRRFDARFFSPRPRPTRRRSPTGSRPPMPAGSSPPPPSRLRPRASWPWPSPRSPRCGRWRNSPAPPRRSMPTGRGRSSRSSRR